MKIRTLKKFLKDYKPIIEIRLPGRQMDIREMNEFRKTCSQMLGDKYLVFVCQIPDSFLTIKKPDLTEEQILEFRKQWIELLSSTQNALPILKSEREDVEFITQVDFVVIHSPFKLPLKIYKKKLKLLQDLVKQKISENNY